MTKHERACDEVKTAIEVGRRFAMALRDEIKFDDVMRILDQVEMVQEEVLESGDGA